MINRKIVLIGDYSTGKTSLIHRFVDNQFSDKYLSTIGVKISRKNILSSEIELRLMIWDIEGGTEAKPINNTYLIGAHGCIIVADLTRKQTIENINIYIKHIRDISPDAPLIIALNKSDCLEDNDTKKILQTVIETYDDEASYIYVTSAKSANGVEVMFNALAENTL